MKLEANITRWAPNDGFICDVDVYRKASGEKYDFRFISPSYYLCITESGNAYVISEYKNKIGCACQDMTFNRTGKEVCKHLEKFMRIKDISLPDISEDMAQLLKAAGWSGSVLTPPDRPETRQRPRLPNIEEPARKPAPQAAQREKANKTYKGMTTEQIVRGMDIKELKRNARRGGIAAQAELTRRMAEKEEVSA
jgi:hypothetical protein